MRRVFFLILALLALPLLFASAQDNTERGSLYLVALVYDRTEEFSPARWVAIAPDGTQSNFADDLAFEVWTPPLPNDRQAFIAPDGSGLAYRVGEDILTVGSASGTVLLTYAMSEIGEGFYWLWGWADATTIYFSVVQDGMLTFYALDVTEENPVAQPLDALNALEILDVGNAYRDVVFAPGLVSALLPESDQVARIAFPGAVGTAEEAPLDSITVEGVFPYWTAYASYPVWSYDGQAVALSMFSDPAGNPEPFIYRLEDGLRQLAPISCGSDGICLPEDYAWSPDSTQVAYWDKNLGTVAPRLMIVTLGSEESRWLEGVPGDDMPLFWSPDGRYLAYSYYQDILDTYSLVMVDLLSGEVLMPYESAGEPLAPVGWLTLEN